MNNFLAKPTIFIAFLLIYSCSYEPIFSSKNYNFGINNMEFAGEKEINRVIKNKLELVKKINKDSENKYNIDIETKKFRKIVSKDSKGDPEKFEFEVVVSLKVLSKKRILINKEIEKSNIYNNDADKFKLEQKERIIINNLSRIITDNILSVIINLNDN